jgi:hypothetical protein
LKSKKNRRTVFAFLETSFEYVFVVGVEDKVSGEWRKLHNELNDLYGSPNIVRVIKSSRIKGGKHVARMEERRVVYRVLVGKPERKKTTWKTQA